MQVMDKGHGAWGMEHGAWKEHIKIRIDHNQNIN